jgi:Rieske Fe-S protein
MKTDQEISRRSFLKVLTMAGAASVALPALRPIAARADVPYVPVGKTGDFKVGQFKKVVLDDGTGLFVTRVDGKEVKYLVLSSKCTHKGCEILWLGERKEFRCPCHGGLYDASGKNISGPPPSPLPSYPTKVQDGKVLAQVS